MALRDREKNQRNTKNNLAQNQKVKQALRVEVWHIYWFWSYFADFFTGQRKQTYIVFGLSDIRQVHTNSLQQSPTPSHHP